MIDILKGLFITGFADLQEAFCFYGLCFLACKLAMFLYKVFMRKRLDK